TRAGERPAEPAAEGGDDRIRRHAVPVVVEAPDHQAVTLRELALGAVNRVLLHRLRIVEVVPEGRLMRNNQVQLAGRGPSQHLEGRLPAGRDAGDRRGRVAQLIGIYGRRTDAPPSPRRAL